MMSNDPNAVAAAAAAAAAPAAASIPPPAAASIPPAAAAGVVGPSNEEQAAAAAIAAAAATWCAEDDVNRMLREKDAEIATLKASLAEQEDEVKKLSAKKKKKKRFTPKPAKTAFDQSLKSIADDQLKSPPAAGGKKKRPSKADARWKARFQQVVAYKLQHGHCNVPKSYKDPSLHAWVRNQRDAKKMMEKGTHRPGRDKMTPERIEALNNINFEWVVGHRPKDAQWDAMFQQLIEYKQQFGHTQVPTSHPGKLGKWVLNQRARRRLLEKLGEGKAKGMTWARVEKLDAIDFVWEASSRRKMASSDVVAAAAIGKTAMI